MQERSRRGRPPHDDVLTPAEWRVVHAIQHGMTSREIARRRRISIDAVKYHVSNVLTKLGLSNRRELRRWFQAPNPSALRSGKAVMNIESSSAELKLGPIGQISRTVKDIKESEAWYRDVLGLTHLYTFGTLAFFDLAGTRLFLTQEGDSPSPESILYLRVADIVATHAMLSGRGVEFIGVPHVVHRHADGTEEWMAFFKDLEGRTLALMSQLKS